MFLVDISSKSLDPGTGTAFNWIKADEVLVSIKLMQHLQGTSRTTIMSPSKVAGLKYG
jgi:hypothetical protein